uniref:Uncharacterized protein n=1 Tax=Strongyloides venezuelensis TaxID=75913 RepID=A0A0K0G1E4_STRVS
MSNNVSDVLNPNDPPDFDQKVAIHPDYNTTERNMTRTETIVTIIFGLITILLVVIFVYYLFKVCCGSKSGEEEKGTIRSRKQKDLRNGKPKKKHNYNPLDIMNTIEKQEYNMEKRKKSAVEKEVLHVEIPNIQKENEPKNVGNLNNNVGFKPPSNDIGVKKQRSLVKSIEQNGKVNVKPKDVSPIYEFTPPDDYHVPIERDTKRPNPIQDRNKILQNLDKTQIIRRKLLSDLKKIKKIKNLKETPICNCDKNPEDKKVIAFTTMGKNDKWETVNENDTVSNFSFQISSRNSSQN